MAATKQDPIFIGRVSSLALNGKQVSNIMFHLSGPEQEAHSGFERRLSGHDGVYIRTSELSKGARVFNWRTWTGVSVEELTEVETALSHKIPIGCLQENITVSGIPNFSKLQPGSRLVFPASGTGDNFRQAILAVWEENGPCGTVGKRLAIRHGVASLKTDFVREAQGKRGVMGFVLSTGPISTNDEVLVYPPVS